ncbi:MAG: TetR/AcrR family transcriptional regulator [Chitinophagales bacterium]|nr:TetR/AcrR family transcriptional regulator [Bacteroidota bacterium]
MQIAVRKERKKEEMRQHILLTAKEIAAKDGWQNVTIRKICTAIGYSAPFIYQYFDSKEQLLIEIKIDGFKQIISQFELVDKKYIDAEKRILQYALVWWQFAKEHPAQYQVMFNLQGAVCDNRNISHLKKVVDYYNSAFSELSIMAKNSTKFSLELCDNLISIIHGFISMRMVDKIKSGNENADRVFKKSIQRFIHSINE